MKKVKCNNRKAKESETKILSPNSTLNTQNSTLPEGWVWVRLGEIAEIITGNTPSKKDSANYGNYIPFVKPPELNDCVINSAEDSLSKKGAKLARIIPPESVLVSCIGNLGKTGINSVPVAFNQQINSVIFPKDKISPRYGFYYFQTIEIKKYLYKIASATTLPIVNKSKFKTVPFPLPPLPEQQRIVSKIEELFTKLDAGVDALKKAKEQIKRYRQAVLKYAFEGKLTEEWREANRDKLESASVLLERIKEERKKKLGKKYRELPPIETSELPELPKGWMWVRVKDIGEVVTGTTPSKTKQEYYGKDYPFFKPTDLNAGYYVKKSEDSLSKEGISKARLLPSKSILVTCIGATIGKTGFIRIPGASNQQINAIIPYDSILPEYIYFICISPQFQKSIVGNASATTLPILNKSSFEVLLLPLPPLAEQQKIVEEIERRFSVADEVEKAIDNSLKQAERLRQSILKKAFEGKLVPQDPNDEPAEKLLKRIMNYEF